MKLRLSKKIIICLIIFTLLSTFNINTISASSFKETNIDDLAFRQEIEIPFDTSLPEAKYQPIDTKVVFNNPCWAIDKNKHSIYVGFDDGDSVTEIESQIYELVETDSSHISQCNVVFLIPEEADGSEKYYVFYDSKESKSPDYEDHLVLEDTHYFYEPISGQKIDIDYYGVWDDGSVIYGIGQVGELLGNPISQGILKFLPRSKKVETNNLDQLGVFDMRYGTIAQPGYMGSSWATSVKKAVLVDGNLMIRVRIEGISPRDDIKSDNTYTYYHSPIEKRRIFVNAHHEVLKDINVEEPSILDGTYGGIVSIKSRSSSIDKMNVGEILPQIYLYNEENEIYKFDVPQNPDSVVKENVLSTPDDIDLGEKAWICLGDDSNGKTHSIILDSNTGLANSDDGVQVKAWVKEEIKLPGLEADTGNLYVARDSYDIGGVHDKNLDKGFSVHFNAVFITLEENGYDAVNKESEIYHNLVKLFPSVIEEDIDEEEDIERFSLKCYVHLAPTIPLGSLLSAATGKKFPYIYAELYKNNSFKSSGSVGRLALGSVNIDLEGKTLVEKINTIFGIFDIRNTTFFKKIVFPDLEPGEYIVKIFKENSIPNSERQFIGYSIVEIKEDSIVHINCKHEVNIYADVINQKREGVQGALVQLIQDNTIISEGFTDENGSIILTTPNYLKNPYNLKFYKDGFLVDEKEFRMSILNLNYRVYTTAPIQVYNLIISVKDKWGLVPAIDISPKVTSSEMTLSQSISGINVEPGVYYFEDLFFADYDLTFRYKSFEYNDEIAMNEDEKINIEFDAEYEITLDIKDSYGMDLAEDGEIIISRSGKSKSVDLSKNGKTCFMVPPGDYKIDVVVDDETIAHQNLNVRSEKSLNIVTNKDSFLHTVILYLGIILILFSLLYMWRKKKYLMGLKLILIGLLIISLISPWWVLSGDSGSISTNSKTLLIPPNIVTLSESPSSMGGQISQVPEEVTMVLTLLSILVIACCILIFVSIFTKNKFKKITKILSSSSFAILILCVLVFFYAMSQITMIGVGNFMGSGEVDVTLPGVTESASISSSWGPGVGFYISIIVIVMLIVFFFLKRRFSNIIPD